MLWGKAAVIGWGANLYGRQNNQSTETPVPPKAGQGRFVLRAEILFPLLMTVLSQSFFTLVRRNLMTLSFLTTRHTQIIFKSCL